MAQECLKKEPCTALPEDYLKRAPRKSVPPRCFKKGVQKLYKSAPVGCGVIKERLTRVSQNSASQDCPSRVLHNCPTVLIYIRNISIVSCKFALQECPHCYKSALQECLTRVPRESVPHAASHECLSRLSLRSAAQECLTGVSCNNASTRVLQRSVQ